MFLGMWILKAVLALCTLWLLSRSINVLKSPWAIASCFKDEFRRIAVSGPETFKSSLTQLIAWEIYTGWRTKCHTIDCARNTFLLLQKPLTYGTEFILIGWKIVHNEEYVQCDHRFASQPLTNEPLHSSQLFNTSLQKARGTTSLRGPWAALQGPHSEVVPRTFWRVVSKSCDEYKGSFARDCEAKRWSHWTYSSLGTIFQPMRINSLPDIKCFCNNKNVIRAQSMVWHFVRHSVLSNKGSS